MTISSATNLLYSTPWQPIMHFDWTSSSRHCSSAAEIFHFQLIRIHSNEEISLIACFQRSGLPNLTDHSVDFALLEWWCQCILYWGTTLYQHPRKLKTPFKVTMKPARNRRLNLRTDLICAAKRFASFLASTPKSQKKQKQFNAEYTECKKESHSTHIELGWVTRQRKTWDDLRANLISTKECVSYRKSTLVRQVDLHLHASPFGRGFKIRGCLSKSHPLNFA